MKARPAGPGGASFRYTTFIGSVISRGVPSTRILTNAPLSISAITMCEGMCPHPSPALRKARLAPRSASRQVSGELERQQIARVLRDSETFDEAAVRLGIDPSTLWRKRKRYGLHR
jgi:transcriptional regulator with GAF, ATPase, and Fis domain